MGASRLAVLWHKIMLSQPVWFLVEVVAKKPWTWSLYSSMALVAFFPILTLIAFTFGSVLSGFIVLFMVQWGLLTLAITSLLSSVAVLVPAALGLTVFVYVIFKSIAMALCAVHWVLALPEAILRRIKQEVASVCGCVSRIRDKLCFWRNFNRNRRKGKNVEVRPRKAHKIRHRNSLHFSDSETGRGASNPREKQRSCHTRKSRGWFTWLV
ncbi:hypothetical protein OS493_008271 [Desmophyllum pertusum]|uniref:Uncharacterized protein n=1 Tax=Desmophyllum pertusum TaxID=174260 RepID=A0A9X0A4P7_9CNID|nr:hypothetical protein OS493_008271 [Desmophyllum pertusum]